MATPEAGLADYLMAAKNGDVVPHPSKPYQTGSLVAAHTDQDA